MSNKNIEIFLFFAAIGAAVLFFLSAREAVSGEEDDFFYRRGMVYYHARMYGFAIEDMEKALAINQGHYRAANALAELYGNKKLKKKSLDYYRISIGVNPVQPDIHYRMGVLYDFFYDTRSSTLHYLKTLEQDPVHYRAHLKLVRYYLIEKKDRKSADFHFDESYKLGKALAGPLRKAADREYAEGREMKSLDLYKKAMIKNPADLDIYFRIAEIHRRRKEYRKAVRYLEKIKHIRPDNERSLILLGNLYYSTPVSPSVPFRIEMAITNLRMALDLNPENRDAVLTLSEIYRKTGDKDKADELLKKFEEMETAP